MDPEAEQHAADACWRCVLPFDRDDPQFVLGFELGAVWSLLDDPTYDEVTATVHASSAEMLLRMAEATRRPLRALPLGEDPDSEWVEAIFGPVGSR